MGTYIMLITLTPEGQVSALRDPEYLLDVEASIKMPGVQTLGVYAVLGSYDFVSIIEAESNEQVARFSLELGVKGGVHITTLPVVPAARLEIASDDGESPLSAQVTLVPELETARDEDSDAR